MNSFEATFSWHQPYKKTHNSVKFQKYYFSVLVRKGYLVVFQTHKAYHFEITDKIINVRALNEWGAFYLLIAENSARQNIGGAKELVVLL